LIREFTQSRIPQIFFGPRMINKLYEIIPRFGNNILIVTGKSSLKKSGKWDEIKENLEKLNVNFSQISIGGEPSPEIIDNAVRKFQSEKLDLIVGIGGGSVIDSGKAISAMYFKQDSIESYLEGVGTKIHDGKKLPYIAIPTTSGTGSEATKNAVITKIGKNGYKKSLRHDNFIPDVAIVDPELVLTCPPSITAACGLDAFTQLLESYVSTKSNPFTDALAYSGMKFVKNSLISACTTGSNDIHVRSAMAYGAMISGITLANAGLGVVHGFASSIGGYVKIPHGIACGTLLSEATRVNIEKLKEKIPESIELLRKHAIIGALMVDEYLINDSDINKYCDILINTMDDWIKKLNIKRLGEFGLKEDDVDEIVKKTGLKNNPVSLTPEDLKKILLDRL